MSIVQQLCMIRNCPYRVSLLIFILAMLFPVCGKAEEEQNDSAPKPPAVIGTEAAKTTEDLPLPIPDTTQILLAIIALLLLGIFCTLLWNIKLFATQKGEHSMNSDNIPLTESCVADEIQIEPSDSQPAERITVATESASEDVAVDQDSDVISESELSESTEDNVPPSAVIPPQEISHLIQQLSKDFETKLKYDASKQELIDKLYKENMEFKEGIIKKFQQAMIAAVIERIDDAAKDIAVFENREYSEENYRKLLASYCDITAGFQDMLSIKFDVECYSGEPLTRFDPKTQRSLKTCPTADVDKNKLVKQTLRAGYKNADGVILRPELVEVYLFEENSDNLTPSVPDLT